MKAHRALAALTLLLALSLPSGARALPEVPLPDVSRPAAIAFDAVVLRPLGAARTVVGAGLFLPAALFSLPGGSNARAEAWQLFVALPAEDLVRRELGDF